MHKQRRSDPQDQHAKYFEAIVQIRPADPEVIDFIANFLSTRDDCKITKMEEFKTGLDVYLTSQKIALAMTKKMTARWKNAKRIISRAVHHTDHNTSKVVYRVTILFRLDGK
ncbi:MAG: NMD3-related protein [Nanoarchaeota archaeon]|nr:NMD3-related protein [Nanoarchaeota archaeon]